MRIINYQRYFNRRFHEFMQTGELDVEQIVNETINLIPNLNSRASYLSNFKTRIMKQLPSPDSRFENLREYHVYARKNYIPHVLPHNLDNLRVNMIDRRVLMNLANQKLEQKLNKTIHFKNFDLFLHKMTENLQSDQYHKLFPALLLVTGRRTIELQKTGRFDPVAGNRFAAIFTGQAKTTVKSSYQIPLLAPYEQVVKALAVFRQHINPVLSNKQLNSKYSVRNYHIMQAMSQEWEAKLTSHSFRGLYAAKCSQMYKGMKSFNAYIAEILGHGDLVSSLHYTKIKIY